jgi:hypothetical protein
VAISVLSEIFNVDLNPNKNSSNEQLCKKILFYLVDDKSDFVKS